MSDRELARASARTLAHVRTANYIRDRHPYSTPLYDPDRTRAIDESLVRALDPTHARANAQARARDLASAHDRACARARNLTSSHDLASTRARDLTDAHDLARDLAEAVDNGHRRAERLVRALEGTQAHDATAAPTAGRPPGRVVGGVICIAGLLLPAANRARFVEEFHSELFELRRRSRLAYALRQVAWAPATRRGLGEKAPTRAPNGWSP